MQFPLRTALAIAMSAALSACSGSTANDTHPASVAASDSKPMNEQALINEITANLQACSYDGAPVKINAHGMADRQRGAGAQIVSEIMRYTGLPQNFEVIATAEVPNAAAVILIGKDQLPHRVIAYNESFFAQVKSATAANDWAPISIMAHEIGHHLSGHTIQPGGSQPPTELEADKFSGFVLHKMGAALADAQKAMNTLVPEADGATHPGRGKRARAIAEGWEQACAQQGADCGKGKVATAPVASATATVDTATTTTAATPASPPAASNSNDVRNLAIGGGASPGESAPARPALDVLPAPSIDALPAKFGKFVIDELGVLDAATRDRFEKQMYALAERNQIEITTIIARSLHGLSGDDYAYAMLRQLRVGKLDVGNGAVLVIAPNEKQVGIAMGAGIRLEMRDYIDLERDRLMSFIEIGMPYCRGVCNDSQTEMAFAAAEHIAANTSHWDFSIRYESLPELMKKFEETAKAQMEGASIEPEDDPTWRKIVKIKGKLATRDVGASSQAKWINDPHLQSVGAPMHVVSDDGRNLLVYADPRTEAMMTNRLVDKKQYIFIARQVSLSQNPDDALSFDLLSYDAAN
ncbi:MAG: TPM domain-containing protein [Rhodanobacteraceae bacterium]|nr:TPM domain-containing protein [Rhodanobacteraceae bacterium]